MDPLRRWFGSRVRPDPAEVLARHRAAGHRLDPLVRVFYVFPVYWLATHLDELRPLLSPAGQMIGLVFAASLTDLQTGYALAPSELDQALEVAQATEVTRVATGACV